MPLTTAERATVDTVLNAIPISDVNVALLTQQLAEAQTRIMSQAATIEALEAKIEAGRMGIATTRLALVDVANALD